MMELGAYKATRTQSFKVRASKQGSWEMDKTGSLICDHKGNLCRKPDLEGVTGSGFFKKENGVKGSLVVQ